MELYGTAAGLVATCPLLEPCGPAKRHGSCVGSVTEWIGSAGLPPITKLPESIKAREDSSKAA